MKEFNYLSPTSIKEIIDVLAEKKGKVAIVAGGTDLIIKLNHTSFNPEYIVDITKINELTQITEKDGYIHIGAAATFSKIQNSLLIQKYAPAIEQACSEVGSPQIRNLGTVGGNIANASPAADSVTALMAYDSIAVLESKRGKREIKVEEIYKDLFKTKIKDDEILTDIYFKIQKGNIYANFNKLGKRQALAISRMTIALVIEKDENNFIKNTAIALGAVNKFPFRAKEAEMALKGKKLTTETIDVAISEIVQILTNILGDKDYAPFFASYKKEAIKSVARDVFEKTFEQMN